MAIIIGKIEEVEAIAKRHITVMIINFQMYHIYNISDDFMNINCLYSAYGKFSRR